MCEPMIFIWEFLRFGLTEKALFQVTWALLLVYADWEKGGVWLRVCMCVCFMTSNYWDMFFVVRLNDSFNFPLGWIKYIVIVVIAVILQPQTILFFQKHPIMFLLSTIDLHKTLMIPNFVTIQKQFVSVSRHLHMVLSTTDNCWQSYIWHTCAVTPKHIRSFSNSTNTHTHTKMWQKGTSHNWQQKVEDWCSPLVLYNIT